MTNQQLKDQLQQAKDEYNKGNFIAAEQLASDVLNLLDKLSDDAVVSDYDPVMRANALYIIAEVMRRRGNFDAALEQAHRVLALAEKGNLLNAKTKAWNSIGLVYQALGSYDKALEFYNNALAIHYELGEKSGIAGFIGSIGNIYFFLGSYDKALEFYNNALAIHYELGERSGIATVTGNIGSVYASLRAYDKALEFYNNALSIHSEFGEKSLIASNTGNIGNVYNALGFYDKALEFFNNALAIHYELGEKSAIARVTGNIGIVYNNLGSYDKALEFYNNALAIHDELGEKLSVALVTGNIGSVYADSKFDGYDCDKAEEFLNKAIAISSDMGAQSHLVELHKSLADLYENEKRWEDAHIHFKKYIEIEKEVNVEEVKKQDAIRQQLKDIELAKAAAAAKLSATTTLLHRVLPESIATRMIAGEEEIADYFPSVSILFADIAGFTPIAAGMPASMVVRFLNFVFGRFDAIMKKYGCEKIKTIGDGYMAVAGAPIPCDDHAERMALAALEMQEDIQLPEEFKEYLPDGVDFGIRVGLHTGSVVGGVIGDERFVYDIYSDSVNTAARMESHGEADKIHVSEEFKQAFLGADHQEQPHESPTSPTSPKSLHFQERGEMEIKGKGIMKTYFLEKA